MKKVRVLVTDDHRMIRDGLKAMLEMHNGTFTFIIDEASSGEIAVEKIKKNSYDVILLDYQLPGMDGADTAQIIMQKKPGMKILALSNYNEYKYIEKMITHGKVKGYILKNIGQDELVKAIETILSGKNYYSNEIALSLLNREKSTSVNTKATSDYALKQMLSKRELEVLRLIADENTNETIADKLSISKRTVETHRQNIMLKLNVNNTVGLIKAALQIFTRAA